MSEDQGSAASSRYENGHRAVVGAMCLVLVVLLGAFAGLITRNSDHAHEALSDRFDTRAALTGSFTRNFVSDLAQRERSQAQRLLSGGTVSRRQFEQVVQAFAFEAAVLLDGQGRLLHVYPAKPELRGRDMTGYAHLRAAVNGHVGVSQMVPSAAQAVPITAVAVPFDTPSGRRVFSGAFAPTATPLAAYLDSAAPLTRDAAFIVDESGKVLAASSGGSLEGVDAAALPDGVTQLQLATGPVVAAVTQVADAPWRVVLLAPPEVLYAPIEGTQFGPWALWLALAISGCLAVVLFVRLGRARSDAAATARTDALTGLPNRRAMQQALDFTTALARRHEFPVAALMIDVDRFKTVNDLYGHEVGDRVLAAVGEALVQATRTSDVAARWGGEEFLVLLPHTDAVAARTVAERVREVIARTVFATGVCDAPVTASIGVASLIGGDVADLLRRADAALYQAKVNGRNRVESADALAAPAVLTGAIRI